MLRKEECYNYVFFKKKNNENIHFYPHIYIYIYIYKYKYKCVNLYICMCELLRTENVFIHRVKHFFPFFFSSI